MYKSGQFVFKVRREMELSCLFRSLSSGWPVGTTEKERGGTIYSVRKTSQTHFYAGSKLATEAVQIFVERVGDALTCAIEKKETHTHVAEIALDGGMLCHLIMPRLRRVLGTLGITATVDGRRCAFKWHASAKCTEPVFREVPVSSVPVSDMRPFEEFEADGPTLDAIVKCSGGVVRVHARLLEDHDIYSDGVTSQFSEGVVRIFLSYLYTNDLSLVYISFSGADQAMELLTLAKQLGKSKLQTVCINYLGKECMSQTGYRSHYNDYATIPGLCGHAKALLDSDSMLDVAVS